MATLQFYMDQAVQPSIIALRFYMLLACALQNSSNSKQFKIYIYIQNMLCTPIPAFPIHEL